MAYMGASIASTIGAGLQGIQSNGYFPPNGAQQQAQFGALQAQVTPEVTDDPETWSHSEQMKMFVWFMKMHHAEDIGGFKALRDIERSVERAEQEQQWNLAHQKYAHGWTNPFAQMAVPTPTPTPLATIPKKKWWEVWK